MDARHKSWDNIDELEDAFITFLLYKEGKSIDAIAKIRNISRENIERHIIEAKIKIHSNSLNKEANRSRIDKLLELSKEDRIEFIKKLSFEEKEGLTKEIRDYYDRINNHDDKMVLIWIVGELKKPDLINIISKDILHRNGNIRRMVCSAIGKIRDSKGKSILHRALRDKKPQVRQYAAKALKYIGDENTIELLKEIIQDRREKEYVKRTCLETLRGLEILHNNRDIS